MAMRLAVLASGGGMGDWMHINSMSVLGPNKWYDAGDERFHPENIIWDGREANINAIILMILFFKPSGFFGHKQDW